MTSETHTSEDRRPIASRRFLWVRTTTTWLVKQDISPNTISIAGVLFGIIGACAIVLSLKATGNHNRLLWFMAGAFVQLRLICNMLDGMVAVESEKTSRLGELFNEVPDRLADAPVLIALGFVPGSSIHLGYTAAILAVLVAYIRAVGGVAGAGQVFAGFMAKGPRMFLVTVLCLYNTLAPSSWGDVALPFGFSPAGLLLTFICAGCVITSCTRLHTIAKKIGDNP